MIKKNPYTKIKVITASSKSLFGRRTEMEKKIEKYENQGWVLKGRHKLRNKESYELKFEYRMSEEEIAAFKKNQRIGTIGCAGFIILLIIIGSINNSQQNAILETTRIFEGTQIAYAKATLNQESLNNTVTATLWTPTLTSTFANTPTLTNTTTITYTPTATYTPTETSIPSITPTFIPSSTITDTPLPLPTIPTDSPPATYYIRSLANARSCEKTTCDVITQLKAGSVIQVVGVVQGDIVKGDATWVRLYLEGKTAYIHVSLISSYPLPTPEPKPVIVQQPQYVIPNQSSAQQQVQPIPPAQQQVVSTIPPNPVVSFSPNCSGDVYNCPNLTCDQVAIYVASCPGDPSHLDGNDQDGKYCEKQCGG